MPTTDIDRHGWTTSSELVFIEGLAARNDAVSSLTGYLAGMKKRTEFGRIDRAMCMEAAKERLDEALAKAGARRAA